MPRLGWDAYKSSVGKLSRRLCPTRTGVHVEVEAVKPLLAYDTGIRTKLSTQHLTFMDEINDVLRNVETSESTIVFGDCNDTLGTMAVYRKV